MLQYSKYVTCTMQAVEFIFESELSYDSMNDNVNYLWSLILFYYSFKCISLNLNEIFYLEVLHMGLVSKYGAIKICGRQPLVVLFLNTSTHMLMIRVKYGRWSYIVTCLNWYDMFQFFLKAFEKAFLVDLWGTFSFLTRKVCSLKDSN